MTTKRAIYNQRKT